MATTFTPRVIAREASKVMGRPVTEKQVRGLARDTLAAYSKETHPAYQSHEYTASERTRLLAVFRARAGKGRKATTPKPAVRRPSVTPATAQAESAESAPDA